MPESRFWPATTMTMRDPDEIMPVLLRLATDIIAKTFKKDKVVSGNVDAKRIREISDEYGICRPSVEGNDLLTVKTTRNDLAHGSKTLAEVGRNFTISDIVRIKDKVIPTSLRCWRMLRPIFVSNNTGPVSNILKFVILRLTPGEACALLAG